MRMVSLVAAAAALALSATPAVAQKNKKDKNAPPAEAQLQLSEEFRKPAAEAETAFRAQQFDVADQKLALAEPFAKNDDEKYWAAVMRMELERRKNSSEGVAKAAAILLVNPRTPAASKPEYEYLAGSAAFNLKKPAEAIPHLLRARELNYASNEIPLLLAQAYVDTGKVNEGVTEMGRAIDGAKTRGEKPKEAWYLFIIARVAATKDYTATAQWMLRHVQEYPTKANWRRAVLIYRDNATGLDTLGQLDLMRVLRAGGALAGEKDYYDYASMAVDAGLPWETVTVIDEGAKGAKVPDPKQANNFKPLYDRAKHGISIDEPLETQARKATSAADGKTAALTGDAFLASGNAARAVELYDMALQKGVTNTEQVTLHRGIALAQAGRKDEARTAFAAVKSKPLSDVALFWNAWLDLPPLTA